MPKLSRQLAEVADIICDEVDSSLQAEMPRYWKNTLTLTPTNPLLAISVTLSPDRLSDAPGLFKAIASIPAVTTANVIVRRSARERDRQKEALRKRIRMAQAPSAADIHRATSFKRSSPAQPRFSSRQSISKRKEYRGLAAELTDKYRDRDSR